MTLTFVRKDKNVLCIRSMIIWIEIGNYSMR